MIAHKHLWCRSNDYWCCSDSHFFVLGLESLWIQFDVGLNERWWLIHCLTSSLVIKNSGFLFGYTLRASVTVLDYISSLFTKNLQNLNHTEVTDGDICLALKIWLFILLFYKKRKRTKMQINVTAIYSQNKIYKLIRTCLLAKVYFRRLKVLHTKQGKPKSCFIDPKIVGN